jgi:putative acetyltransferase
MNKPLSITITHFSSSDQDEAKALILAGMQEHWGEIDPALNLDLNDIAASYSDGVFLVARLDHQLVGTGAYKPVTPGTVQIVRMSVMKACRRVGIARSILNELVSQARSGGMNKVILETTADWQDAIAFYLSCGFVRTEIKDGDQYFEYDLPAIDPEN